MEEWPILNCDLVKRLKLNLILVKFLISVSDEFFYKMDNLLYVF